MFKFSYFSLENTLKSQYLQFSFSFILVVQTTLFVIALEHHVDVLQRVYFGAEVIDGYVCMHKYSTYIAIYLVAKYASEHICKLGVFISGFDIIKGMSW